MTRILHLDASVRHVGSQSRILSRKIADTLKSKFPDATIKQRDVLEQVKFIDNDWTEASFTPEAERGVELDARLKLSNQLASEVIHADHIVIGTPLYNFTVPASLKAWIDHICRPGLTFEPTEEGFEGLLKNKTVYLAIVSGSTDIEGPIDFATPYLKQVFRFLGVSDVRVVSASNLMIENAEDVMANAISRVAKSVNVE